MRYEYRLSKYDPSKRDLIGAYREEDWVGYFQIGTKVRGTVLSKEAYSRVEDAYVLTIEEMLREAGLEKIAIERFRVVRKRSGNKVRYRKGQSIDLATLTKLCRLALKERVGVAFSLPRKAYLHFGFDFLVYIGLAKPSPVAIARAKTRSLFIEEMPSPHRRK